MNRTSLDLVSILNTTYIMVYLMMQRQCRTLSRFITSS
nr:MAG TPA: hypothetical protein [Caudoviricetes sp.]